ncbi:MAG: DUF1501 domain-containing protein [Burkholderiales bacterium]|nr:DUF1501 domain-containing protein [Burkholderiales bacterium]
MPSAAFSDKKFLIVMLKDGGEDSYHTLMSRQPGHVAACLSARPTLAFTQGELDSTYASSRLAGTTFSLHPALQPLTSIWNAGEMAVTHRVGPMFTDISSMPIETLRAATSPSYAGAIQFPFGLGAHDKQAFASGSLITREFFDSQGVFHPFAESGFIGRLATRFASANGTSIVPSVITAGFAGAASNRMSSDASSRSVHMPDVGQRFRRNWTGSATQNLALARLDAVMAETRTEPRVEAFRQANQLASASIAFFQPVVEAPDGTYAVDQDFPGHPKSGWTGTMRTIARTMEADIQSGALRNRTTFVATRTAYDTHFIQGKLTGALPTLHAEWAASVVSFRAALIRLGLWQNTLILDHSEFSRTLLENGSSGTDHAYARDAFAFGGAVRGYRPGTSTGLYGTYPSALSATGTGSSDLIGGQLGGGSLAPGLSLEQYWHEPLTWFGADSADIAAVMPRRAAFGSSVDLVA